MGHPLVCFALGGQPPSGSQTGIAPYDIVSTLQAYVLPLPPRTCKRRCLRCVLRAVVAYAHGRVARPHRCMLATPPLPVLQVRPGQVLQRRPRHQHGRSARQVVRTEEEKIEAAPHRYVCCSDTTRMSLLCAAISPVLASAMLLGTRRHPADRAIDRQREREKRGERGDCGGGFGCG